MTNFSEDLVLGQTNPMYINGEFVYGDAGDVIQVMDPATGAVVGTVPNGGAAEAKVAIAAAHAAFPKWAALTPAERADVLMRWADLITQHKLEIARILTTEQGKPLSEALEEAEGAAMFTQWYAEEGKRLYGETIPGSAVNKRILVIRQPIGVAALITPWNYPATMVSRKAAPALAAGCTLVLKPASQTPLTAIALIRLAHEAGMPPGVINLVTGNAGQIGEEFMANPLVRKVSFTGSTEVGKHLIRASADGVKKLSLELGGNAPFIVFPDADIDAAVAAAVGNKFENCGQMCNGINVLYIHEQVVEEFSTKFAKKVKELRVGKGTQGDVQLGPVIDTKAIHHIDQLLEEAVEKGARIEVGGRRLTDSEYKNGSFYEPTVVVGVQPDMKITQEEIFGPVAPIVSFQTEEEMLAKANNTPFGLAAYVFTRDVRRVFEVSEQLEVGMVAVNSSSLSVPQAPFGGIKQSGYGREGGHFGLEEFTNLKYISLTL